MQLGRIYEQCRPGRHSSCSTGRLASLPLRAADSVLSCTCFRLALSGSVLGGSVTCLMSSASIGQHCQEDFEAAWCRDSSSFMDRDNLNQRTRRGRNLDCCGPCNRIPSGSSLPKEPGITRTADVFGDVRQRLSMIMQTCADVLSRTFFHSLHHDSGTTTLDCQVEAWNHCEWQRVEVGIGSLQQHQI